MKYCKYCGKQIEDNIKTCPFCHGIVSACTNTTNITSETEIIENKSVSIGLIFLSVLFPIVGIVLGITKWGKENKAAKKYLVASAIGICIGLLFNLIR